MVDTEPLKDKQLLAEVEGLNPEQRDLYDSVLMKRRRELQQEGSGRNISTQERLDLIERVRRGALNASAQAQFPNADLEKASRDFDSGRPTFIDKSLPTGDKG